jgi:hypothetical protein
MEIDQNVKISSFFFPVKEVKVDPDDGIDVIGEYKKVYAHPREAKTKGRNKTRALLLKETADEKEEEALAQMMKDDE